MCSYKTNFKNFLPFFLSVFLWTPIIILSELPAKVAGTCKSGFICNGGNRFLSSIKLSGSLCQPVLNQIRYRRTMYAGLKICNAPLLLIDADAAIISSVISSA